MNEKHILFLDDERSIKQILWELRDRTSYFGESDTFEPESEYKGTVEFNGERVTVHLARTYAEFCRTSYNLHPVFVSLDYNLSFQDDRMGINGEIAARELARIHENDPWEFKAWAHTSCATGWGKIYEVLKNHF